MAELREQIKVLSSMFTEDEIVAKLEITHLIYRRLTVEPGELLPLTRNAAAELVSHDDGVISKKQLATQFRCPYHEALNATQGMFRTEHAMHQLREQGYTRAQIADKLGIPIQKVTIAMRGESNLKVLEALVEQGLSAEAIAEEMDVSVAYVYQNWSKRKPKKLDGGRTSYRKYPQTTEFWAPIIEYAKMYGKAAASRKFNVARTSINYYINKNM